MFHVGTSCRTFHVLSQVRRRKASKQAFPRETWERLKAALNAHYVALSYSSGGRATAEQLHEVLTKHGKLIKTIEIEHKKNVMAEMKWTHEWLKETQEPNREFIFLIEK